MNNYVNKNKVLEKEFVAKWYNTVDEEKRRNDYINKEIDFWKLKSRSKRTYWEFILPKAMPILDVLSGLKPVSDEMLSDFIAALTFSRFNLSQAGLLNEQMNEINRLALPVLSVLKEYLSSEGWRAYILSRCIPESKTIWNRYNAKQWDSVNEREALLFFSEDKEMLLLTGKQVEMLKSTYLKENEGTNPSCIVPIFKEDNIEILYDILKKYFVPEEQFYNLLVGQEIQDVINFKGNQNQLAGIFITLKEDEEAKFGTHEETYQFIKQTFLINNKPIESKQILSYLKDNGSMNSKTGEITKKGKLIEKHGLK